MVIDSVGDLRSAHIYFEFSCGFGVIAWLFGCFSLVCCLLFSV